MFLDLGHRVPAEVEDRGAEDRVGACAQDLDEVVELAGTPRSDHRDRDGPRNRAGQLEVVAGLRPVAVHARQEDLPGPSIRCFCRPLDRVDPLRPAAPGGIDLPAAFAPAGIDRDDDALGAEPRGHPVDQPRLADRRGVDAHLVGPGVQDCLSVINAPDPAPDGERNENVVGGPAGQVGDRLPLFVGSGDVQEHQLVGALGVVALGELDRVAGVPDVDEVGALDGLDVVGAAVGVGRGVGILVGDSVGRGVGLLVGDSVGRGVGERVGDSVGRGVGLLVGDAVGLLVGDSVGRGVGLLVGDAVGERVGERVGSYEGEVETLGVPVGSYEGEVETLGVFVGERVGAFVGE